VHDNTSAATQSKTTSNPVAMKVSGWNGLNGLVAVLHVLVVPNTAAAVTHVPPKSIWNLETAVILVTGLNGLNGPVVQPHVTVVPSTEIVTTLVAPLQS